MMGLGGCFGLTETSLELFYTQMRRERNSFWHSLFDGGGVPTDYMALHIFIMIKEKPGKIFDPCA